MALESFGTEAAEQVNHAVILCHDLLKENPPERVNEIFMASDPPFWWVRAGSKVLSNGNTRVPIVVIELGVG